MRGGQLLTVSNGLVVVLVLEVDDGNPIKRLALHLAGRAARLGRGRSSSNLGGSSSSVLGLPPGDLGWLVIIRLARASESKAGDGQNGGGFEQHLGELWAVLGD